MSSSFRSGLDTRGAKGGPTHLRIFLASPSDVDEERRAVRRAVKEVNSTSGALIGVHYDLLDWESSVYPALGADGQDVINRQIGNDYDILLVLLWARLGTPTPRAASGTVEEYERALERRSRSASGLPEIMLYFKSAPIAAAGLDPEQTEGLERFRQRVQFMDGALTYSFRSARSLERSLRLHLALFARDYLRRVDPKKRRRDDESKAPRVNPTNSNVGLSALENVVSDGLAISKDGFVLPLARVVSAFDAAMAKRLNEVNALDRKAAGVRRLVARQIAVRMAEDIALFSKEVRELMPVYREHFPATIASLAEVIGAMPELTELIATRPVFEYQARRWVDAFAYLVDRMRSTVESLNLVRVVVEQFDTYGVDELKVARRRMDTSLATLTAELEAAIPMTDEARRVMQEYLDAAIDQSTRTFPAEGDSR